MSEFEKYGYIINDENRGIIITKYVGNEKNVVVPEEIDGKKTVQISAEAFSGNKDIVSIQIADSITHISEFTFKGCVSLKKIILPKGLKVLERGAFEKCVSLEAVEIEEGNAVYSSKDGVVYASGGLELAVYPPAKKEDVYNVEPGTQIINSYAFSDNQFLKTINICKSVNIIDSWAFTRSKCLEKVNIEGSLNKIGVFAFSECKMLSDFTIPSGINSLESGVFYNCTSLKKVSFPKGFKKAERHTFFNCPIDTLCVYSKTKPIDIIPDVKGEFTLYITYDSGDVLKVLFNRTYFYSRLKTENDGSLDINKYDEFFKSAVKLMSAKESANIALSRIISDFQPSAEASEAYISYLKAKSKIPESFFENVEITPKNARLVSRLADEMGYFSQAARIMNLLNESRKKYEL